MADAPPLITKTWVYRLIMFCVHTAFGTVLRVKMHDLDQLPPTGGVLIAANHQSFADIPLIAKAAGRRHVAFVARDSLAKSRIFAFVMDRCGAVLIRREGGDRAALRRIAEHLKAGDCVAIFPEGTRTHDGSLGKFKKGALVAARMANCPIVPCAISGSGALWPRGQKLPHPGHPVEISFAAPLPSDTDDVLESVRDAIAARLPDPRQVSSPS